MLIRGILFSRTDEITPPDAGLASPFVSDIRFGNEWSAFQTAFQRMPYKEAKEENLRRFNAAYIGLMLSQNDGNVTRAAKSCGLERQSLQQIMRRYNISPDDFRNKSEG
jgi:DNA-binding NtrC family response regulator